MPSVIPPNIPPNEFAKLAEKDFINFLRSMSVLVTRPIKTVMIDGYPCVSGYGMAVRYDIDENGKLVQKPIIH